MTDCCNTDVLLLRPVGGTTQPGELAKSFLHDEKKIKTFYTHFYATN